jgi:hypothetical protein
VKNERNTTKRASSYLYTSRPGIAFDPVFTPKPSSAWHWHIHQPSPVGKLLFGGHVGDKMERKRTSTCPSKGDCVYLKVKYVASTKGIRPPRHVSYHAMLVFSVGFNSVLELYPNRPAYMGKIRVHILPHHTTIQVPAAEPAFSAQESVSGD